MVLKPADLTKAMERRFESSVNSDGTQTIPRAIITTPRFESSVNSDGTQTKKVLFIKKDEFESSGLEI